MHTRAEMAALYAIELRYWAENASDRGYLQPGVRAVLESIADDVTIDAQLEIAYKPDPPPPRRGRPIR
jgi:hypothetical protein